MLIAKFHNEETQSFDFIPNVVAARVYDQPFKIVGDCADGSTIVAGCIEMDSQKSKEVVITNPKVEKHTESAFSVAELENDCGQIITVAYHVGQGYLLNENGKTIEKI